VNTGVRGRVRVRVTCHRRPSIEVLFCEHDVWSVEVQDSGDGGGVHDPLHTACFGNGLQDVFCACSGVAV
jgi:hypothetical protein